MSANSISKFYYKIRNNIIIHHLRKKGLVIGEDYRIKAMPDFGSEPYLIHIGKRVTISFGVVFLTHDGATCVFRQQKQYKDVIKFGRIIIGDNSFIGARSTIMPNVTIGSNSIIGACSLVTKDVPDDCVYAGSPAKYICSTKEYADKCLEMTPDYDKDNFEMNKQKELTTIFFSDYKKYSC